MYLLYSDSDCYSCLHLPRDMQVSGPGLLACLLSLCLFPSFSFSQGKADTTSYSSSGRNLKDNSRQFMYLLWCQYPPFCCWSLNHSRPCRTPPRVLRPYMHLVTRLVGGREEEVKAGWGEVHHGPSLPMLLPSSLHFSFSFCPPAVWYLFIKSILPLFLQCALPN